MKKLFIVESNVFFFGITVFVFVFTLLMSVNKYVKFRCLRMAEGSLKLKNVNSGKGTHSPIGNLDPAYPVCMLYFMSLVVLHLTEVLLNKGTHQ